MALEFKRTGAADFPRHLKILNLAAPKAGKTTFEATAPNSLIAATPNAGLMSIAHLNVPYVDVKHSEEVKQLKDILASDSLRAQLAEKYGIPKIETITIDLLDDLQRMLQKERLRAERRTQFQRDDWGWLLEQMREIVSGYVALPLNVIFSVHTKSTQDDESRIITTVGLQGAFAEELPGYVDFVVMSQKSREVDPTGKPYIKYSLLVESDNKAPGLGNRAAGRLDSVVEPDFKVLYDAVFSDLDKLVEQQPVELQTDGQTEVPAPTPAPASEEVAQPAGQVQQAPAAEVAPPADPTPNVQEPATPPPSTDEDNPINDAGIQHVTKFYNEFNLNVPSFDGWTLGEARSIARMFVATKGDMAEGKGSAEDLIGYLQAMDASKSFQVWAGQQGEPAPETAVQTPVETPSESAEVPVEGVTSPTPPADVEPSSTTPETPVAIGDAAPAATDNGSVVSEAEAVKAVEEGLGGRVIGVVEDESAPCVICGKSIDDVEIARLAKARFEKWACVADYIELTKA